MLQDQQECNLVSSVGALNHWVDRWVSKGFVDECACVCVTCLMKPPDPNWVNPIPSLLPPDKQQHVLALLCLRPIWSTHLCLLVYVCRRACVPKTILSMSHHLTGCIVWHWRFFSAYIVPTVAMMKADVLVPPLCDANGGDSSVIIAKIKPTVPSVSQPKSDILDLQSACLKMSLIRIVILLKLSHTMQFRDHIGS